MKINEYEYKSTPSIDDKIIIQENGGDTLYSTINDIFSKTELSNLDTNIKNIIGGINHSYNHIPYIVCDFNDPPNSEIFHASPGSTNAPSGLAGNAWIVIQQYPGNSKFSTQLVFGFGSNKIAMRRKNNSVTWSEWEYFAPVSNWKYFSALDVPVSAGQMDMDLSSIYDISNEILISYGIKNNNQSYGGGTITVPWKNEGKPSILPTYSSGGEDGYIYLYPQPSSKTFFTRYFNSKNASAIARCILYYR